LTLVEAMRAEWHVSLHDALWSEPIAATLALWPALLSRHGCEEQGDSYVDRQRRKAKAKAQRWLDAHYEVVRGK
jgi:hypothetical protein